MSNLKTLSFSLSTERERLKTAIESEVQVPSSVSNQSIINLKNNLNQVLQQNSELRNRLVRIQEASDLTDLSSLEHLGESVSIRILMVYIGLCCFDCFLLTRICEFFYIKEELEWFCSIF